VKVKVGVGEEKWKGISDGDWEKEEKKQMQQHARMVEGRIWAGTAACFRYTTGPE
jgi:hypothetical protein